LENPRKSMAQRETKVKPREAALRPAQAAAASRHALRDAAEARRRLR